MSERKFGLLYDDAREARLKELRKQRDDLGRKMFWLDDEIRRLERAASEQYQRAMVELLSENPGTEDPAPLSCLALDGRG
jgi:hypothetical protein